MTMNKTVYEILPTVDRHGTPNWTLYREDRDGRLVEVAVNTSKSILENALKHLTQEN